MSLPNGLWCALHTIFGSFRGRIPLPKGTNTPPHTTFSRNNLTILNAQTLAPLVKSITRTGSLAKQNGSSSEKFRAPKSLSQARTP